MSTKTFRLLAAVALVIAIITIMATMKLTLPFKAIIWMSVSEFAVVVVCYPWVWKPRNFTFSRALLFALMVAGGNAVILIAGNLIARL